MSDEELKRIQAGPWQGDGTDFAEEYDGRRVVEGVRTVQEQEIQKSETDAEDEEDIDFLIDEERRQKEWQQKMQNLPKIQKTD